MGGEGDTRGEGRRGWGGNIGRRGGVEGRRLIKTQEVQELKFTDTGLKPKKVAP